jgi:hypothetical protein
MWRQLSGSCRRRLGSSGALPVGAWLRQWRPMGDVVVAESPRMSPQSHRAHRDSKRHAAALACLISVRSVATMKMRFRVLALRVMAGAGRPSTPCGADIGKGVDGGPAAAMTGRHRPRPFSAIAVPARRLVNSVVDHDQPQQTPAMTGGMIRAKRAWPGRTNPQRRTVTCRSLPCRSSIVGNVSVYLRFSVVCKLPLTTS